MSSSSPSSDGGLVRPDALIGRVKLLALVVSIGCFVTQPFPFALVSGAVTYFFVIKGIDKGNRRALRCFSCCQWMSVFFSVSAIIIAAAAVIPFLSCACDSTCASGAFDAFQERAAWMRNHSGDFDPRDGFKSHRQRRVRGLGDSHVHLDGRFHVPGHHKGKGHGHHDKSMGPPPPPPQPESFTDFVLSVALPPPPPPPPYAVTAKEHGTERVLFRDRSEFGAPSVDSPLNKRPRDERKRVIDDDDDDEKTSPQENLWNEWVASAIGRAEKVSRDAWLAQSAKVCDARPLVGLAFFAAVCGLGVVACAGFYSHKLYKHPWMMRREQEHEHSRFGHRHGPPSAHLPPPVEGALYTFQPGYGFVRIDDAAPVRDQQAQQQAQQQQMLQQQQQQQQVQQQVQQPSTPRPSLFGDVRAALRETWSPIDSALRRFSNRGVYSVVSTTGSGEEEARAPVQHYPFSPYHSHNAAAAPYPYNYAAAHNPVYGVPNAGALSPSMQASGPVTYAFTSAPGPIATPIGPSNY